MRRNAMDVKLVERICNGNREAMEFLANYWAPYCHEVDDVVDGDRVGAEALLETLALAVELYSHPFYLKHLAVLRGTALRVTEVYAQTVAWERREELGDAGEGKNGDAVERVPTWREGWADMHRHCSNEMCLQVALICGGYRHARRVMEELRVMAWHEHHDEEGRAK